MDKLSASEALFGVMWWLTSLETPVTFSSHHEAGIAAQLVDEFCKANNLAEPREFSHLNLHHPTSRPTKRAPDAGDSAVSTSSLQASALSTSQAESAPTQRG